MKYILKYKDFQLGTVEGTEEDFLNLWGSLEINNINDEALSKFIEISIRESDLIEEDHIRDISSDMAKLELEMEPYFHFIESEDWVLITENQEILNIMVPSFKSDNSIVWRWRI